MHGAKLNYYEESPPTKVNYIFQKTGWHLRWLKLKWSLYCVTDTVLTNPISNSIISLPSYQEEIVMHHHSSQWDSSRKILVATSRKDFTRLADRKKTHLVCPFMHSYVSISFLEYKCDVRRSSSCLGSMRRATSWGWHHKSRGPRALDSIIQHLPQPWTCCL